MKVDSSRIRVAGEVLERAERMIKGGLQPPADAAGKKDSGGAFQRIIDEAAAQAPPPTAAQGPNRARASRILEMSRDGKSVAQIAKNLGITQNEVMLVIGLEGRGTV